MNTIDSAAPEVEGFARAVRSALSDLPADEIDELTEGLEADLVEQAGDADAPHDAVGDPVAYAAELRAAAGLPPRTMPAAPRVSAWEWASTVGPIIIRQLRATPSGSEVLDFLLALRPAWWVLRGWAFFVLVSIPFGGLSSSTFPTSPFALLALLALIVVSVQWGRGRWLPKMRERAAKTVIGILATVALLFAVPITAWAVQSTVYSASVDDSAEYVPQGLTFGGVAVRNVFAYDADGEYLENVQLFDQDGYPLDLVDGTGQDWVSIYDINGIESTVVPSSAVPGRVGWNVYPLREADSSDIDYTDESGVGTLDSTDTRPARPPFREVQPIADGDSSATYGSPAPSDSPSPSLTPSPSPSP